MERTGARPVVQFMYPLLYVIIVVASWLGVGQSWIVREPAVLLFIAMTLLATGSHLRFPSLAVFLLLAYGLAVFVIGMALDPEPIVQLAASRFVVFYPFLLLVGYNLCGRITQKQILLPAFLFGILCVLGGLLEATMPTVFAVVTRGRLPVDINLYRTGLGLGLGSIVGSRVDFGMLLVLTIAVAPLFVKSRLLLGLFECVCAVLVALTLNRTAIVTTGIVLVFRGAVLHHRTGYKPIASLAAACTLAAGLVILSHTPLGLRFVDDLSASLRMMDLTLSGRTANWADFLRAKKVLFAPDLKAFGVLTVTDEWLGVADNALLKYVATLGLPVLVPLVLAAFSVARRFNRMTLVGQSLIVMLLAYSVTLDWWHMAFVVVPSFLVIGLDLRMAGARSGATVQR